MVRRLFIELIGELLDLDAGDGEEADAFGLNELAFDRMDNDIMQSSIWLPVGFKFSTDEDDDDDDEEDDDEEEDEDFSDDLILEDRSKSVAETFDLLFSCFVSMKLAKVGFFPIKS